jgi:hypothetical protein
MRTSLLALLCLASFALPVSPALAQERYSERIVPGDECGGPSCGNSDSSGRWNPDGSYTDRSGQTIDGAGRGRAPSRDYAPYARWQTADARFNSTMNRITNDPRACVTLEDSRYSSEYLEQHSELWDAWAAHGLPTTRLCAGIAPRKMTGIAFYTPESRMTGILNRLADDSQSCISTSEKSYVIDYYRRYPGAWFGMYVDFDLPGRFCS